MANISPRPSRRKKAEYSWLGNFLVISLGMFCLIVVPIKLFVDQSGWAALIVLAMIVVLCGSVWLAGSVPVIQRERRDYTLRRPMELDAERHDPTRDGLSW